MGQVTVMLPSNHKPVEGDLILRHIWKNDPILECKSLWRYKETVVIDGIEQYTVLNSSFRDTVSSFEPHHIYVLTTKKVKPGDYVVDVEKVKYGKVNTQQEANLINKHYSDYIFKVKKTTNPKLELPRPSEKRIEKYIKEFQKNFSLNICCN